MQGKGIQVEIVADSVNPVGRRITTMLWKYPRFIHSEIMTHRVLSRNAASSRAIPVSKIINAIQEDPALPVFWGKQQSGMQAAEELTPGQISICHDEWLRARNDAIVHAENLMHSKLHKQIANRILEPWFHIVTLVTSTEWGNFFNLRVHKDAQPEFQVLAAKALEAWLGSTPTQRFAGDWHLPFNVVDIPIDTPLDIRLKIVTARAARTSYKNFDGTIDINKDIEMHDSLAKSGHWSPFEHAAQCRSDHEASGNFRGWTQYRKMFDGENQVIFDGPKLLGAIKHVGTNNPV